MLFSFPPYSPAAVHFALPGSSALQQRYKPGVSPQSDVAKGPPPASGATDLWFSCHQTLLRLHPEPKFQSTQHWRDQEKLLQVTEKRYSNPTVQCKKAKLSFQLEYKPGETSPWTWCLPIEFLQLPVSAGAREPAFSCCSFQLHWHLQEMGLSWESFTMMLNAPHKGRKGCNCSLHLLFFRIF